jgi:hypothetical protein
MKIDLTRIVFNKSNDENDDKLFSFAICSRIFFIKSIVVSTILSTAAISISDDGEFRAARIMIVRK